MELPPPTITPLNQPYWSGLESGELRFQRCQGCSHAWLPPREECPNCLLDDWDWELASGRGRIISWVVYHLAFHEALQDRLPYNVAVVELDEGPRLITNVKADPEDLEIDQRVGVAIEAEGGVPVARFRLSGTASVG